MKGAVFIAFNQMVEDVAGIDVWEQLLLEIRPESGGIYTSIEDFPDTELFNLVEGLSSLLEKPVSDLIESFGDYLFGFLNKKYPVFSRDQPDFFGFIESIDGVIHKEVRKLYNNTLLPKIDCKRLDKDTLIVEYSSPRKLCILAEGLIRGAAQYYKTEYTLDHMACMHNLSPKCIFKITKHND